MDITKIRRGVRIGVASLAVVLASGVAFTQAANRDVRIHHTGPWSNVDVNQEENNDLDLRIDNEAFADNFVHANVNTGENSASGNTGDGEVDGGDVEGRIRVNNVSNSAMADGGWDNHDHSGTTSVDVDTTGPSSNVEANLERNNDTDVNVNNNASAFNGASGWLNSGDNETDHNTGDARNRSGDVNVDARMTTDLNQNAAVSHSLHGAGSMHADDTDITVGTTGPNSNVGVNVEDNNETNIEIRNHGEVVNEVDFELNTGGNSGDGNTGNSEVTSGDAGFNFEITNLVN